jgi:hypothetical protein
MTVSLAPSPTRRFVWVVGLLIIAVEMARLVQIVPRWAAGSAPAYPGQYEARLLNALELVPLMVAVLVNSRPSRRLTVRWFLVWGLLIVSVGALVFQAATDR